MSHRVLSLGTIAVDTMLYVDKMPGEDGFGHIYSEKIVPGRQDPTEAVRSFIGNHHFPDGYICTLGCEGADWFAEEKYHCGICKVDSVDTTGAGDAYIAGIIDSYFCKGKSKQESMKAASAIAALKTLQPGPRFRLEKDKLEQIKKKLI